MLAIIKFIKSSGNICLVVLALLFVQIGLGLYPVITKRFGVGNTTNLLIFCMVRDIFCLPLLLALALISEGWLGIPNWKDCLVFAVLGVTGIFLSQLLFLLGVPYIGANVSIISQQLTPICTIILAIITCTEKFPSFKTVPTWLKLFGVMFAIVGAIEMTLFHSSSQSTFNSNYSWIGYIAVLFNDLVMSIYIVCQKRFIFNKPENMWRNNPIWVTTWSYLTAAVCICVSSLYYVNTPSVFYISQEEWLAIVYAIIVTSCLCYILLAWANSKTNASIVAAFWPFQVVPCFIGSYLINGEVLNPFQYIGAVLVITGLFAVVFGKYLEERRERTEQQSYAQIDN